MSLQVSVMGETLTPDIRTWKNPQRKVGSLLALIASFAVTALGVGLWILWGGPMITYWILLGILVLVLVFMVALMVFAPRAPKAAGAAATAPSASFDTRAVAVMATTQEAMAESAPPMAPSDGPRVLTLRCGDCGTIFDVTDNGERPLYHSCPGCGAEGALQDEAQAPALGGWEAPAEVAVAPAAPAMKKLRLRCGGCKEIFSIEDTGERPLKRPCPHCGRMGQIS